MDTTEVIATEENEMVFEDRINELVTRLENTTKELKNVGNELKTLKKEHLKIVKKISVSRRKKTVKDPDAPKKAPSGFAKPTQISAKLAEFLGISEGDMIARPDVTKGITVYVKKHNLQKKENKRAIDMTKPGGEVLADLLNLARDFDLTFFNLQKYLKIHFPTSEKEVKANQAKAKKTEEEAVEAKKETKETKKATKEVKEKKETKEEVPVEETSEEKPRRRRKVEETA